MKRKGGVMMIRAKLTSKGQITIPVAVRHKLDLQPGDELLFEFDRDDEVKLRHSSVNN